MNLSQHLDYHSRLSKLKEKRAISSSSKKQVLICDDEARARQVLRTRFNDFPEYEIVGEATTGLESLKMIQELSPDIVMLDIEMPFKTGLEVYENIGLDKMPPTIFVTAYNEFAVKAFDLYAVDYLLKPFTKERFGTALRKAEVRSSQVGKSDKSDIKVFLEYLSKAKISDISDNNESGAQTYLQRITVDSVMPWVVLEIGDIEWFSAEDHFVRVYTSEANYLISAKISDLESQLEPSIFCRIHRSQIVNLKKIKSTKLGQFSTLILTLESGQKLKVSRSRKEACQITLMKWDKTNL